MNKYTWVIVTVGLFACAGSPLFAQEAGQAEWDRSLSKIKQESESLLEENQRLSLQGDLLDNQLAALQQTVTQEKSQQGNVQSKSVQMQTFLEAQKRKTLQLESDLEKLTADLSSVEEKNEDLKKQMSVLEETQNLWQLKLTQLNTEKNALNLEARKKGSLSGEEEKLVRDIKDLQAQLNESKKAEDELNNQLSLQADISEERLQEIKKENEDLTRQVGELKKQQAAQAQKNRTLEAAAHRLKNPGQDYKEKLAKRNQLRGEIAKLESQIKSIESSIDHYSKVQDNKRKLLDEIMSLDRGNEELRTQIIVLKKKMLTLKQSTGALENEVR